MKLAGMEFIDCPDCPHCRPESGLRNGVKYGICARGGNVVYLEPWKEKRTRGNGYIHHDVSSCGTIEKRKESDV